MTGSLDATVTIRGVYDYTPEAVDKLLNSYRSQCPYSHHVECRFNPAKQQFVLEGDGKLMEYAVLDFMDSLHKTTTREPQKPPLVVRLPATLLNINPVRWIEHLAHQPAPTASSALWNDDDGLVCDSSVLWCCRCSDN